ncbi:hypothetical protein [Chryseobacterium candidae]|uniref:IPT/TIG domain-containing protein n=1 Tax=Chryseobacterium candidae TaxID=1978493 RepID=A0ABY2R6L3_9FLAO|nr:hypothetical protein [Chryseobacterium candidae]THV59385.1 hypothetical protein EK417_11180 [Chryseobacterium candidae]
MKKKFLVLAGSLFFSHYAFSQVGVNTQSPNATLDVVAKTTDGTKAEGILAPRLTGDQIKLADNMYTALQKGAIVYATSAVSSASIKTNSINAPGYYYFDGLVWRSLSSPPNIYNSDGYLTGPRAMDLNYNTLWINGASSGLQKNLLDLNIGQDGRGYGYRSDDYGINISSISSTTSGRVARINFGTTPQLRRYLSFSAGNDELMYITNRNGGQIGIGTTEPQNFFHIDGSRNNPQIEGTPPTAAESLDDFTVKSDGSVGIGTYAPTAKLELNSGTANVSGLKFTNLNSSTPVSSGATLGVNANGEVVTVNGNAFTPAFGKVTLPNSVVINGNTTNDDLINIELPSAGTYLISYTTRGEFQNGATTTAGCWMTSFLNQVTESPSNTYTRLKDSEILVVTTTDSSRQVIGGTGSGTYIVTVTGKTKFSLGVFTVVSPISQGGTTNQGVILNNNDGRTSISYVKITP